MSLTVEAYLARVDPTRMGLPPSALAVSREGIASRRRVFWEVVGEAGVAATVDALGVALLGAGSMNPQPVVVDLTPDLGFTGPLDRALRGRGLRPRWAAMAQEPAALRVLAADVAGGTGPRRVMSFLGSLEDVERAVGDARRWQPLPELFDGAVAVGLAHRGGEPERFFSGLARVMAFAAPVAWVDGAPPVPARWAAVSGPWRSGSGDPSLEGPSDALRHPATPAAMEAWALERFHQASWRPLGPPRVQRGDGPLQLYLAVLQR